MCYIGEVRELSIREMRASLGRLDELLEEEGELIVTRRGKEVARVLPMKPKRRLPSHRDLRARMPLLRSSTEILRADRDGRG